MLKKNRCCEETSLKSIIITPKEKKIKKNTISCVIIQAKSTLYRICHLSGLPNLWHQISKTNRLEVAAKVTAITIVTIIKPAIVTRIANNISK